MPSKQDIIFLAKGYPGLQLQKKIITQFDMAKLVAADLTDTLQTSEITVMYKHKCVDSEEGAESLVVIFAADDEHGEQVLCLTNIGYGSMSRCSYITRRSSPESNEKWDVL